MTVKTLYDLPEDEYHGIAGHYGMSSLLDFETKGPRAFRDLHHEPVEQDDSKPSDALRLGRAYHCYILEGEEAFEDRFMVGGPKGDDGKPLAPQSKAYREWKANIGGNYVTDAEMGLITRMYDAVMNDPTSGPLLDDTMIPEVSLREARMGWTLQARMDGLTSRHIIELKGCADINRFHFDFKTFGYDRKAAAYIDLANRAGLKQEYIIIAVEKTAFPRVACFRVGSSTLMRCTALNNELFRNVTHCIQTDDWPVVLEPRPITTIGE